MQTEQITPVARDGTPVGPARAVACLYDTVEFEGVFAQEFTVRAPLEEGGDGFFWSGVAEPYTLELNGEGCGATRHLQVSLAYVADISTR